MSIVNRILTLSLAKSWQPCKEITIRKAIENMTSNPLGEPPEYGLDVEYGTHPDGTPNWSEIKHVRVVDWVTWCTLPVRGYDLSIQCGNGRLIRAPLVTICSKFERPAMKEPRLSKRAILERDGHVCQYTGKKLPASRLTVDHVIPRDKGGKDRFENLVACEKKLNHRKGNRFNHEVGLKLLRQPVKPKAMPVAFTIKEPRHPAWLPFLTR